MKRKLKFFLLIPLLSFLAITTSLAADSKWELYKQKTVSEASKIPGWCPTEKTLFLMDLIYKKKLRNCIEIGVFSGKSLFPIAKTLKYLKKGVIHGIDGWSASLATKEMDSSTQDYKWWRKVNFSEHHQQTIKLIEQHHLNRYCRLLKQSSIEALHSFLNGTIDFIHIDGSVGEQVSLQEVELALIKLKNKGYLLLNNPTLWGKRMCLVYLLERADLLSPFVPGANYYLFQKNEERMNQAAHLFIDLLHN